MNTLGSLQRAFQRHVLRPSVAMERRVLATPRAGAKVRLAIYANAYRERLIETLGIEFEGLRAFAGEAAFRRLALGFIAAHPSRHPNLRWYGAGLASYLARAPRWRARPALAEMAKFEWALGLAFDAADAPPLAMDAVARIPAQNWPRMTFRLHPSVRVVALRSNAPRIWRAARDGQDLPRPALRKARQCWVIWRRDLVPYFRELSGSEARALDALARGRSFGEICAGLRRHLPANEVAPQAARMLRGWIEACMIDARPRPRRRG
jgi:hypothetical protein